MKRCAWAGAVLMALFLVHGIAIAQDAPQAGSQAAAPAQKIYSNEQLDQMLAPIALYPDSLLSQLLMAATYPGDFAEATDWVKANPKASGDDAVKQVESKPWDPSVKSLVAFPQVLAQFGAQPDWVQKVGDAFLAQPEDVMASVQHLRAQAQKAGTLKTTEQQKVIVQQAPAAPSTTIIQIEPANPQIVYVPTYNPTVVYGAWAYPAYPPYYYPPPPYYYHPVASGLAAGIAFGIGVAAINSCWGGFNWGHHDVNINVNRYNNINVNNRISGNGNVNWNHNAANRRGTPYADNRSRQNYGQGVAGANNRAAYRGNTTADANRQRAQQSFNKSTGYAGGDRAAGTGAAGAGNRAASGAAGSNRAAGGGAAASNRTGGTASNRTGGGTAASNRAGASGGANRNYAGGGPGGGERASSASRSNAFSGASSPQSTQRQTSRGESSQRSMSSGGGHSGGGRQVSRPAPSRGGGGGGRKR